MNSSFIALPSVNNSVLPQTEDCPVTVPNCADIFKQIVQNSVNNSDRGLASTHLERSQNNYCFTIELTKGANTTKIGSLIQRATE